MITYKGLPAPLICDHLSREQSRAIYAPGTEFQIGKIEMVSNTGTYLDTPFHCDADGFDLERSRRSTSIADLPGVVVRVAPSDARADRTRRTSARSRCAAARCSCTRAGPSTGAPIGISRGIRILTEQAAIYLRDAGAVLVGIDSLNIDCTDTGERARCTRRCCARASQSSST